MAIDYRLNTILRELIIRDFDDNQKKFAEVVGWTKQEVNAYYRNRRPLQWKRFREAMAKAGYKVNISVEKKK